MTDVRDQRFFQGGYSLAVRVLNNQTKYLNLYRRHRQMIGTRKMLTQELLTEL